MPWLAGGLRAIKEPDGCDTARPEQAPAASWLGERKFTIAPREFATPWVFLCLNADSLGSFWHKNKAHVHSVYEAEQGVECRVALDERLL